MHAKYFAGLFLGVLYGCAPQERKEMKFDLSADEGKTYRMNIFRETGKQAQAFVNTDTVYMEIYLHVLPKNRIRLTFLHMQVRMPHVRVGNTEYDFSAMLDSVFAAVKGLSVQAQIDSKGMTQTVSGMEALLDTVALRLNKERPEVKRSLADYISEDAIKDNLNRLFSSVPSKKVNEGKNWGSDVVLTTKAPVNINSLYTLTNLHSDSAFINIHSTIVGGSAGHFYLNGEQNGSVVLNYNTGLPYRYETSSQSVTKTDSYNVHETERFIIVIARGK